MKKIIQILFISLSLANISAPLVFADSFSQGCESMVQSSVICGDKRNANQTVKDIVNLMLWAVGIISVVVIIFAGLLFIVSVGNSATIAKAKNAIIYAVIGLIISMSAYLIVNFVLSKF